MAEDALIVCHWWLLREIEFANVRKEMDELYKNFADQDKEAVEALQAEDLFFEDPEMRQQWLNELVTVTDRITSMRTLLKETLIKVGAQSSTGNWDHITT